MSSNLKGQVDASVRRWKRYPSYKDCGIPWIGQAPSHWEVRRLKFCLKSIEQGWSPACESRPAEPHEWGVLKVGCVNGTAFNPDEQKALPSDLKPIPELEIRPGDVLMSRANTRELLGSASVVRNVRPRLLLCDKLYRLRAMPEVIDPSFLVQALGSSVARYQMEREATGASGSMQNIAQGTVWNLLVLLPSLPEQRRILAFLGRQTAKIDALIAKKERLIELLQEKRTALVSQAVTKGIDPSVAMKDSGVAWLGMIPAHWDVVRTKAVFRLVADHAPDENEEQLLSIYTDIGVRPRKELEPKGNKATTTDGYFFVKRGDLIVNKLLAWMGAIGVSHYEGVTSPAYDILRKRRADTCPDYFHYLFRCGLYYPIFRSRSRGIMDMRLRLYFDEFGQIPIPYPPPAEQNRIVEQLNQALSSTDKLDAKVREAVERLCEYRTALISAAVTGKIDVREEAVS